MRKTYLILALLLLLTLIKIFRSKQYSVTKVSNFYNRGDDELIKFSEYSRVELKPQCPNWDKYHPSNACIFFDERTRDFKILIRYIDYNIEPETHKLVKSEADTIQSRNLMSTYDLDTGKIIQQQELNEDLSLKQSESNHKGIEDCRAIVHDNELLISCTSCEYHTKNGPRIVLSRIDGDGNIKETRLLDYESNKVQKNWLPFVWKDQLCFLYSADPLVILKYDVGSGSITELVNRKSNVELNFARGSAPPIEWGENYLLGLTHEVINNNNKGKKFYLHRFILWDKDTFEVVRFSDSFFFQTKGIEFCLSMVYDEINDSLIFPISTYDDDPYLINVPSSYINSLLINQV